MSSVLKLCLIVVAAAWLLSRIADGISVDRAMPAAPAPQVETKPQDAPQPETATIGETALQRAPDGHFYAIARINGADIRFLVDTGASTIALNVADAERAGMFIQHSDYTGSASTANGTARIAPIMLDRVELGGAGVDKVQAAVIAGYEGTSLLGQSFLSRFRNVSIDGDVMTLR